MADRILSADGPNGRLFACIAPGVRSEGRGAASRFSAFLTPYPNEEAARAALAAADGVNIMEGAKR
jgi:hypothetical protein